MVKYCLSFRNALKKICKEYKGKKNKQAIINSLKDIANNIGNLNNYPDSINFCKINDFTIYKIKTPLPGKSKRKGLRVFVAVLKETGIFIMLYAKSKQESLKKHEVAELISKCLKEGPSETLEK